MNDDIWALETFSGVARLFPLPNLVLFPNVVQPLHIFEPRYRQMTTDALASDRLIAMAMIETDIEPEDPARPPLFPIACLGRIAAEKVLDDGRYLLLLRGLARVRILDELEVTHPYRMAHVELMPDRFNLSPNEAKAFRTQLGDLILPHFTGSSSSQEQLRGLFDGEMPLGSLVDCLAFQLPLALPRKQQLLEETDVGTRAQLLLDSLYAFLPPVPPATPRKFPPDFSLN